MKTVLATTEKSNQIDVLRKPFSALLILVAGVFLIVQPKMPHSWVVCTGLVIAGLAFVMLPIREKLALRVTFAVVFIVILMAALPQYLDVWHYKRSWEESIRGGETLVLALDSYYRHNQIYPVSIHELVDEGYIDRYPENIYCARFKSHRFESLNVQEREGLRRMQPVTESLLTTNYPTEIDFPGNFAYLPRIATDEAGNETATGFSLLVFGRKMWAPGWWDKPRVEPIVAYYYNSETGKTRTWK